MIEIIQAFDETFNLVSAKKLIRCKDCKYWQDQKEGIVEVPICKYDCRHGRIGVIMIMNADDYCSRAEIQEIPMKEEVVEDLDDKAGEESNEVV